MTSDHMAWQQRVNREDGNERRFASKAEYQPVKDPMRDTKNYWVNNAQNDSLVGKT